MPQDLSEARVKILSSALGGKADRGVLRNAVQKAKGDWTATLAGLQGKLPDASLKALTLAHGLADWSGDNVPVVAALATQPGVASLRDVALNYDVEGLTALVDPKSVPPDTAGKTPAEKQRNFAVSLRNKLFVQETSAVLQRMAQKGQLPIADAVAQSNVAAILGNIPDFNIRTASVYAALQKPEALKGIPEAQQAEAVTQLKTLARVQALTSVPEAVPVLMKANLTSAFQVAEMGESTFLSAHGTALGGQEAARQVYTNALNNRIRNEHALMTMREAVRGSGLAIIDGAQGREARVAALQQVADKKGVQLNLETLFGGTDECACEDCLNVHSPASYFVEILQYLRNNDLDPNSPSGGANPNIHPGIAGTPLEKLFRRRPDLGCLELTCENTFTVLPYIDLVNEVMESFVVHLGEYTADKNDPKQALLDVFNVEDETTSELLAQPQHVNYQAYGILKSAVYPFTLPYHQPIDAIRIFLKYLGSSRYDLLDVYRTAHEAGVQASTIVTAEKQELESLHETVLTRAVEAERLGLTQEEYIILTKEALWPKRYFEITMKQPAIADKDYQDNIGVKPVYRYYGYDADADMLSTDEDAMSGQIGLTFVKKQFLPRTGVLYVDLVELLKTRFINPNYPQGKALTILESIRFSYRFLQTLVDTSSDNPAVRFATLIDFLDKAQPLVPLLDAMLHPDPCKKQQPCECPAADDLRQWVYCYFERLGSLSVLESGEGARLVAQPRGGGIEDLEGEIYAPGAPNDVLVGYLRQDGTIFDAKRLNVLGRVSFDFSVAWADGQSFVAKFGPDVALQVFSSLGSPRIGLIDAEGLWDAKPGRARAVWTGTRDTCDLSKVRLTHLDGSTLTDAEYDRMHRFVRLWRKLGWAINEVDSALSGPAARLAASGNAGAAGGSGVDASEFVSFATFKDDSVVPSDGMDGGCNEKPGSDNWPCPGPREAVPDITTVVVCQLAAILKLIEETGLPLPKLLSFWSDIDTAGDKSLYSRLFLTHNLVAIDKVFKADKNGNYLSKTAKISDHLPVLMAALSLKADDITTLMQWRSMADQLTLANVTALYKHGLLAKLLHVKITDLADLVALLGEPFASPRATLELLKTWGKMEDAGFSFRQLNYMTWRPGPTGGLVPGHDDPLRPLAPPQKTILTIAKTLCDGLNGIDRDHPDVPDDHPEQATDELIRAKGGLVFDQGTVDQVIALLDGTTVYTTNAPPSQTIAIPDPLAKKLSYTDQANASPPQASIHVIGIFTDAELTLAKSLSNLPAWAQAIDRAGKQARTFFNDVLGGIFADANAAVQQLLAGDVLMTDPQDTANTAPQKRVFFLKSFLPFLRKRLSHRLVVDTLSGVSGLSSEITDALVSDILTGGDPPQSAMTALEQLKNKPAGAAEGWKGYLIPQADDAYEFAMTSDAQPAPIVLDGQTIAFTVQQEDPSNVWFPDPAATPPLKLKAGKLYDLAVGGQAIAGLQWKTAGSRNTLIPSSALLPDYSAQGTGDVLANLTKCALLVNGFDLNVDEVSYWQSHAADFHGFDFNKVTFQHWKRLQAYTDLRDNLPKTDTSLLDLFQWATHPDDPDALGAKITAATVWKQANVEKLLAPEHYDLDDPTRFRNEVALVKLRKAIDLAAKIGIDIDSLFDWAKPGSKFWENHLIAESVRRAIRARFTEDEWEQVVKPLNDQLREHQKQALIAYLLVQKPLIDWGVVDADSLFEFFLIDVQMGACLQTSRIKQAISSVQLFVQRCMLGLESKLDQAGNEIGVPNGALDRDRWDWMQKYRVWEANRKVFLYPENWIDPGLRDDKSPFYKELESEMLQKDINTQTVQDALKNYLFKVDEVAHLQVVGLFLDEGKKLHVFARTHNAPYFFYYRYFDVLESNWYPWEKMQVAIPSHDLTDEKTGHAIGNGSYVAAVVWKNRLLVFFPEIAVKTRVSDPASPISAAGDGSGGLSVPITPPTEYSEIKLAWSEYRNGKWTQKQVSRDSVLSDVAAEGIARYSFVPDVYEDRIIINVLLYMKSGKTAIVGHGTANQAIGAFRFVGSQLYAEAAPEAVSNAALEMLPDYFQFFRPKRQVHSLQSADGPSLPLAQSEPYFDTPDATQHEFSVHTVSGDNHNFHDPQSHKLLGAISGGLDDLFESLQGLPAVDLPEAFGDDPRTSYNELKRAYAIYNWELGFHSIMQLVDRLLKAQQFDQALEMIHYVLDPSAKGSDAKRFWKFPPFNQMLDGADTLESLFLGLQPGQSDDQINAWRNKPFQPHVIARFRPSAYMKYVAMKYIEILIAYGDYYFRQFTLETIPLAIQCYVLASHVYGPRGQKIPKRGKVAAETYNALLDKWDAFGNAMVELELVFPFSNQTSQPLGVSNGVVGLANVFGFASTLYFCIPSNPQLTALRNTIDDRLFKIRHCQDIDGITRQLPLFEPPIDPALLVQAAAQGLSLSSVLNDLNSPMPNYRFYYLLQKALEVCSEVKSLGNSFLSTKEKVDGEALSRLRAQHETGIQNLVMEVRKLQLDEAQKSLDALQQSRLGPKSRMQYFLKLIGEDLGKVPDGDTDFSEIANQIEQPIDESGLKLIQYEKEEMDKASDAKDVQTGIGALETLASILHVIPAIGPNAQPFGIGMSTVVFSGTMIANAAQAVAKGLQIHAADLSYQSSTAGRKGGFLRQLQDRVQQANAAGIEIKHIDKQILAQQIRIAIANQEIKNEQQQIDNAKEVEDFLRSKYTNQELYSWMEGQIRTLYYQAYTLAYDLAKRAEKVFRFERGLETSAFIQFGYWDPGYDGLLAGERLYVGLKQLETAYQEKRGYDFEISVPFSLRQIDPIALLQLKETGRCEFSLPEVFFDMVRPGDYMRRIKSVSLTIPCIVGPYVWLSATLRLQEHRFRTSALVKDKNDYPERTDGSEDRFSTMNVPITSIATSTGQSDSGVFELNFRDERYLPFEGAGAISKWTLELPAALRQFDYDSITDVNGQLRCTSVDGGDKLQKAAAWSVGEYIKSVNSLSREEGLFAAFDLRHDFPNEWYKAMQVPVGATERIMAIDGLLDRLPIFTQGKPAGTIQATDIYVFTSSGLSAGMLTLTTAVGDQTFTDGSAGMLKYFVAHGDAPFSGWQLKIRDVKTTLDKLWLVVRYVLL
jgi:hypothetical protein